MNLASLIPPWVFFSLVIVNIILGVSNILIGHSQLAIFNGLSATCCYIGYRISMLNKKDK